MHLLVISLLTILTGTLLLAKFRKDMPGKFFAFISWFFIGVGFLLFIGFIAGGICRLSHRGCAGPQNCHHEMMMKNFNHGLRGGACCPQGMEPGMCGGQPGCMPHKGMMKCCPEGKTKMMCFPNPGCMPGDTMMKNCCKHMSADSSATNVSKK